MVKSKTTRILLILMLVARLHAAEAAASTRDPWSG